MGDRSGPRDANISINFLIYLFNFYWIEFIVFLLIFFESIYQLIFQYYVAVICSARSNSCVFFRNSKVLENLEPFRQIRNYEISEIFGTGGANKISMNFWSRGTFYGMNFRVIYLSL